MKLTYVGPHHPGVDLPLPNGLEAFVERNGDTPELDNDFAAALLDQPSNWQPAQKKQTAKPAQPADAGKEE